MSLEVCSRSRAGWDTLLGSIGGTGALCSSGLRQKASLLSYREGEGLSLNHLTDYPVLLRNIVVTDTVPYGMSHDFFVKRSY